LRDGRHRIEEVGALRDEAEVRWVLLAFNLPTAAQRERHLLRTRLTWAGFGMLQGGLWIAPAPAELAGLVDDPLLSQHLSVFTAEPHETIDIEALSGSVWALDELAAAYRAFIDRWADGAGSREATEPLARQLLLGYEWLELLRRDPRLPASCLPADWPAAEAQTVFRGARDACARQAELAAVALLAS
jgi:phenylacetic acid degradation operon negative regulatory protein